MVKVKALCRAMEVKMILNAVRALDMIRRVCSLAFLGYGIPLDFISFPLDDG